LWNLRIIYEEKFDPLLRFIPRNGARAPAPRNAAPRCAGRKPRAANDQTNFHAAARILWPHG